MISQLSTAARFEIDEWLAAPGWEEPVSFTEEATALTTPFRVLLDAVGEEADGRRVPATTGRRDDLPRGAAREGVDRQGQP